MVLLGDHGVGKTSLAGIFAGITEKDEQPGGEDEDGDGVTFPHVLPLMFSPTVLLIAFFIIAAVRFIALC